MNHEEMSYEMTLGATEQEPSVQRALARMPKWVRPEQRRYFVRMCAGLSAGNANHVVMVDRDLEPFVGNMYPGTKDECEKTKRYAQTANADNDPRRRICDTRDGKLKCHRAYIAIVPKDMR